MRGDVASQVHLTAKAMPAHPRRSHLAQQLEGAPLASASVDDERLVRVERETDHGAEDLLLACPQRFRHPVAVEAYLANGDGFGDVFAYPLDPLCGRCPIARTRVIAPERAQLRQHGV